MILLLIVQCKITFFHQKLVKDTECYKIHFYLLILFHSFTDAFVKVSINFPFFNSLTFLLFCFYNYTWRFESQKLLLLYTALNILLSFYSVRFTINIYSSSYVLGGHNIGNSNFQAVQ